MSESWPELDWLRWRDTAVALQLRTQIVDKIRLALTPCLNHSWHVPLYVSARGLTTSPIRLGARILEIEFDFLTDSLNFSTSDGDKRRIALAAGRISDFHTQALAIMADLDVAVTVDGNPREMADSVPFAEDHTERPYDANAVRDFWRVLIQTTRVFDDFGTGFLGKASPTHFFWGSFDLASTRFSGRAAPRHPGGVPGLPDAVAVEAYSDQEASLGFWPGSDAYPNPAFYAYAWPAPAGYAEARGPPRRRTTTRRSESSSCLTKRCAPRRIPTTYCCPSPDPLMAPPPILGNGPATASNVRSDVPRCHGPFSARLAEWSPVLDGTALQQFSTPL